MKQLICSTVAEWFQIQKSDLLYYFSDSENKYLKSLNIILKWNKFHILKVLVKYNWKFVHGISEKVIIKLVNKK